jgi:hypothetical protein
VRAWERAVALAGRAPEIMNTDQGAEFTSADWIGAVQQHGALVSQDGRGRCLDNVMVERLWRTVKYEHVYLHDHFTVPVLRRSLGEFFPFYNTRRWHSALAHRTPQQVWMPCPTEEPEGGPAMTFVSLALPGSMRGGAADNRPDVNSPPTGPQDGEPLTSANGSTLSYQQTPTNAQIDSATTNAAVPQRGPV